MRKLEHYHLPAVNLMRLRSLVWHIIPVDTLSAAADPMLPADPVADHLLEEAIMVSGLAAVSF